MSAEILATIERIKKLTTNKVTVVDFHSVRIKWLRDHGGQAA